MKFIKKRLDLVIYLVITNTLFVISNIPLYFMAKNSPPGTYFPLIHGAPVDYFLYLSVIRESMQGAWTAPALFTSEPTVNSFLYNYFILIGKLASILHLNSIYAYHLGRIISFELMIVGIYFLCRRILDKCFAVFAALIGLLAATPPPFILKFFHITPPLWWEGSCDIWARFNYLPHHAFGMAMLIAAVVSIFKFISVKSTKLHLVALLFSFATGLFYPPCGLVLVFGIPISLVIIKIHKFGRVKKIITYEDCMLIFIALAALLGLMIIKLETLKGFPWSQWKDWDMAMWNSVSYFNRDFLIVGGFALLLSLPTVISAFLKRDNFKLVFLSVWAILPYLLLNFADILGIGRLRLAYMATFVPLGILSAITVIKLAARIKPFGRSRIIICLFILFLYLGYSFSVAYGNIKRNIASIRIGYSNIHISASIWQAIDFLNNFVPKKSVVLADEYLGTILPAFVPVKSYFAHVTQTKDYVIKGTMVRKYYQGLMSDVEVEKLMSEGKINYVISSPMEKDYYGDNIKKYRFPLKEIYDKDGVTIYKVKAK